MNKSASLVLGTLLASALLSGCQTPPRQNEPNLGDLYRSSLNSPIASTTDSSDSIAQDTLTSVPKTKLDKLNEELEIYKSARDTLQKPQSNPKLIQTLDAKILTLEIHRADEYYNTSPDQPEIYNGVIDSIKSWLQDNPDSLQAEDFQYQLARLLSVSGNSSDAELALAQLHKPTMATSDKRQQEVSFRVAELAFSQNDYQKAVENYSAVLEAHAGSEASFQHMNQALYMRAWSYLQLNDFAKASNDFLRLLTDNSITPSNPQMLDDIYRGFTLAINDAGGIEAIPSLVDMTVFEPISMEIYDKLIRFYLSEKRWSEVIQAYQGYQVQFPGSENAKVMAVQLLAFLEKNKQKASLRAEKAKFIEQYASSDPEQTAIYALELAEYHRSEALAAQKSSKNTLDTSESFAQSLKFYDLYLNRLASGEMTDIRFAYAETLLEAGQIRAARQELNSIARGNGPEEIRQEAAYLALTSLETQLADQENPTSLLIEKRQAARDFIENFPQHTKTKDVLQWLMVDSFQQQDYDQALEYATQATDQFPSLIEQAQQITADSLFANAQWFAAGEAYERLLAYPTSNPNVALWRSNAMKAYYQAARKSEPEQALGLFAKVYNSGIQDIAPAALYEAAMIASKLVDQEDLSIKLLNRYILENPKAPNTRDAQLTLAGIYKENKNWTAAAPLLKSAAQGITDPELKQTADLEVADLYYKANNYEKAMSAYTALLATLNTSSTLDYESAATARSRLIDIYMNTQQQTKALIAMEDYVELDLNSDKATPKTRAKAEKFALNLAEEQTKMYQKIELTGNLQDSFKRKQQAMEKAIQSYKRLEAFETEHAITASYAGIGNLFTHLSQALLKAPVPQGLSELEKEEYMIIVEEQAFPFEEKAVDAHKKNIAKLHQGQWHEGIESSLEALRSLLPARFDKRERFEGAVTHAE